MSSEAPRIMPAHTRNEAPAFNAIDVNTCYWSKELPDLGLVMDMKLPFRVYVMACEPRSWGGPKTVSIGLKSRGEYKLMLVKDRLPRTSARRTRRSISWMSFPLHPEP